MNARSPIALASLVIALAFAGCVQLPAGTDPVHDETYRFPFEPVTPAAPTFDFGSLIEPDHAGAHGAGPLHPEGHGLKRVGHAPVSDILPPGMQGSITSIDVWGDYAAVPGMQGELGFVIVDIADPANPRAVGYHPAVADGWTARFSDDGAYVFYGCQILSALSPFGAVKGDCRDAESVHAPGEAQAGIVAVDVSDKTNPTFVASVVAQGSHNLQTKNIDGEDYVFTAAVEIIRFDRENATLEIVAEVPGRHDATVHRHPLTGDWLLYTGTSEGGFAVYDVNDPTNPQPVHEGGLEGVVGWHEQTPIPVPIGGRAYAAFAGETFASPTGALGDALYIVDVTDPANPEKVSEWQPPFAPMTPWASYLFSAHEIAASATGQLAVSWYHAGTWVLDVSTPERLKDPVVLGAYLPNEPVNVAPSTFAQTPFPYAPFVWGNEWDDRGYLIVPDMHTGVYVLAPDWGLVPGWDGGN